MHHRFVHFVSGHPHRPRINDPAHRNHRDVRGPAADIDHHVSRRLFDRQPRANRRGHGLLHQIHFARPRAIRRILHRSLFHWSDFARHPDHNPRMHQHPPVMRLLNKIRQHLFGDFEIRNHPVFHRLDRHHVARRAPQHVFCFAPHRHHVPAVFVDRYDRGFVHHDPFAPREHQRVRRPQIDGQVG